MLTWRYHLLSLVAVFLALGLGVLVGISLSDNGVVETGRAGLVEDIMRDVDGLRDQNDVLSRERATNLRFQDDAFPFIVGGRLQGKKVALVASGKAGDDILRQVATAIHGAGGQVISTTVMNAGFDPEAAAARMRTDLKNDPALGGVDASSMIAASGQQIAREVSGRAGAPRLLPVLQGSLVDSRSGNYEVGADAVVLLTRADDEQSPAYTELEKQMLLSLRELGVMPIGAEPADAPRSEIPLFLSVDVSSVDNIESRIGQVSLVFVLGGEKGAFGVKPTADMLIPILRTPRQSAVNPAQ